MKVSPELIKSAYDRAVMLEKDGYTLREIVVDVLETVSEEAITAFLDGILADQDAYNRVVNAAWDGRETKPWFDDYIKALKQEAER